MPKRSQDAPGLSQGTQGRSRASTVRPGSVPRAPQGRSETTQRLPKADQGHRKSRPRAPGSVLKRKKSMPCRLLDQQIRFRSRGSLGKRSRIDVLSIFGWFRESDEPCFVSRLSAKTRVRPCVPCIDVQHRKTLKIDPKIDPKSSLKAARAHSPVDLGARTRSVERLRATRGDSGWLGRPRSVGKSGFVDRCWLEHARALRSSSISSAALVGQHRHRYICIHVCMCVHINI